MRFVETRVSGEQAGRTVRSLMAGTLFCSSTLIKQLKTRENAVLLNGVPVPWLQTRVNAGDLLRVDVDDEQPIPAGRVCTVPVLYEDEDYLVLNKPAGMAVHPSGTTGYEGTVAEAVTEYLGGRSLHCVNRLDRGTSGLMAVAKSSYAHERMRTGLLDHAVRRVYCAVVHGRVMPPSGCVDLPIAREQASVIRRTVDPDGAPARTRYETLTSDDRYSLLKILPETGRTHQIRVHMAAVGHPLYGDWLYGEEEPETIRRPALHSAELRMENPITGAVIDLAAPLPDDMRTLLASLTGAREIC